MAGSGAGTHKHGIPNDPAARKKIRDGLSDSEKVDFDAIVSKIAASVNFAHDRVEINFFRIREAIADFLSRGGIVWDAVLMRARSGASHPTLQIAAASCPSSLES